MSDLPTKVQHRSFKELESWKKARVLRNEVFELCKRFPSEEKYRLADQLIRSTRSITANIAEGHGRFHFQENIQYCRIARGSSTESVDHLTVALDCGYIDEKDFEKYSHQLLEIERILNGYIRFLNRQKRGT